MICKNCNAANDESAKFCTSCGSVLEAEEVKAEPVVEAAPVIEETVEAAPVAEAVEEKKPVSGLTKAMGIVSLVCGILGFMLAVSCCGTIVSPVFSIAAIVCGVIPLFKKEKSVLAVVGLILGAVAIAVAALLLILGVIGSMAESGSAYSGNIYWD